MVRGGSRLRRSKPAADVAMSRTLLAQSDFAYVGYHTVSTLGDNGVYARGLTHRYVAGQQRLLAMGFIGTPTFAYFPYEFTLTGNPATGGSVSVGTSWTGSDFWGSSGGSMGADTHGSPWWEESASRLWLNYAWDYPQGGISQNHVNAITTRTLNSNGTASNVRGFWGLEGIGSRAIYGGVRKVPSWFASANSTGPYLTGFGGYSSLAGQGLGPAYGPMFVFIPDPHGYTDAASYTSTTPNIPALDFKIGADCRGAVTGADYGSDYAGRLKDRGVRKTLTYDNWYDSSDSRSNPTTRPTYPTDWTAAGEWWGAAIGGAAPNDSSSYGRWTWGDSHYGCLEWIDNDAGNRSKHGIVCAASLLRGYGYYANSTLNNDNRSAEIHVYHPDDVALVLAGSLAPYKLRPRVLFDITGTLHQFGSGGTPTEYGGCTGSTFDPTTNRLYVLHSVRQEDNAGLVSHVHVFDVAA